MKITVERAYEVLGLEADVTDEERIRTAYRKRALATHPDKGGDAEKFKEVGAAYAKLQKVARGEPVSDGDDDEDDDGGGGE
jgi:DnaJ homolog subfamily A member 2